jgi:hypothetical protein
MLRKKKKEYIQQIRKEKKIYFDLFFFLPFTFIYRQFSSSSLLSTSAIVESDKGFRL